MPTDFAVALRVVASDGVTVVKNLNDHTAGLSVVSVQEPEENVRRIRVSAPRVDGDYSVAESDEAGDLVAIVTVEGDTWAQVMSRWQDCRSAYRAEPNYFVETEIEGVTTRYWTERPNVSPAATDTATLAGCAQTYAIRWHVQPNPTVTTA